MDENRERRRAEPQGFVPDGAQDLRTRWRSVVGWVFGDREGIEQEGLLNRRDLTSTRQVGDAPHDGEPVSRDEHA
jgi:hypothetical protein